MPKISIIIPVYNMKEYLSRCLDSILKQTFNDFEVICVNDGSTDNSLEILTSYSLKDERFKIINQENQGVSIARNVGIENAQGEYIQFVDGDDWIEPDCLELAYKKICETKSDIVFFCYNHIKDKKIISNNLDMAKLYSKNHNKKYLIEHMWTCWNKIFKKEFLLENNIKFKKEVFFGEDGIFNLMCLYKYPKMECLPAILYNHTLFNPTSANCRYNGLEEESSTLKILINFDEFINADNNMKILSINRFCSGILSYYSIAKKKNEYINQNKLITLIKEIEKKVDKNILKHCHEFIKLKSIKKQHLLQKIFKLIYDKM